VDARYISFTHPQNWFSIDFPEGWNHQSDEDHAVQFTHPEWDSAALMLFRVPIGMDTALLEQSGKLEQIVQAMFAQVGSTNIRPDPTIIYTNFTADRTEEGIVGQRWFVVVADLMLGISMTIPEAQTAVLQPVFERMLSSFRVDRAQEHLAVRIMHSVYDQLSRSLPHVSFETKGLQLITDNFEVSIGNLLAQVSRKPESMDTQVAGFVQGIVNTFQQHSELGKESWATVQSNIVPLIKPDKYVQDVNQMMLMKRDGDDKFGIAHTRWLVDLCVCYAIDAERTFRFVNESDLKRWGVTVDKLHRIAIKNLIGFPKPRFMLAPQMPGASKFGVLEASVGTCSSYVLHPRLYQWISPVLGNKILAAIPSRDAMMLFKDEGQARQLLPVVERDFKSQQHAVSDRLFRVTPDGITLA
jgi:uncharacterized protein YtpQ (UPF0354 family)